MARDVFIRLHRCQYCNRPGFAVWDADLFTCDREICKTLAFAEIHRRSHSGLDPEVRLAAPRRSRPHFRRVVRRSRSAPLQREPRAA